MSAPCIIAGSLVDAKNVGVHKCLRLIVDVPVERAGEVLKMFGWPTMADPIPVAIARLTEGGDATDRAIPRQPETAPRSEAGQAPGGARKSWDEMSAQQQAGIRCSEPLFWAFLQEKFAALIPAGSAIKSPDDAADIVRFHCDGVKSRSEFATNSLARRMWRDLDTDFGNWKTGAAA